LEHNAVARPLAALQRRGVEVTQVPCTGDGVTDPADILAAVRPDTDLVVLSHASNVLGTVLPVGEVGPALRERGVPLLVDAAQTAGTFPIDVEAMGISLLAASGHKGLLGPQGVGLLYVAPDVELDTLVEGGTGSRSESLEQPSSCPDRFEAGTPNSPGIAGLGAGIRVVERDGVAESGRRQYELARRLAQALAGVDRIRVYGPWRGLSPAPDAAETWSPPTAPIISLAVEGLASAEVARILDKEFQIAVRAGLHCAPEAHRVAGTLQEGLVRLSVGHTTTEAEVAEAAGAPIEIADSPAHYWPTEWEAHNAQ
jgi:selenocysteine lyase/cysteine desulfurase